MATYPSDATAPVTAFPVVAEVTYSSTGASRTYFNGYKKYFVFK